MKYSIVLGNDVEVIEVTFKDHIGSVLLVWTERGPEAWVMQENGGEVFGFRSALEDTTLAGQLARFVD